MCVPKCPRGAIPLCRYPARGTLLEPEELKAAARGAASVPVGASR
jgi:hypothetical protein